jgi:uncharacterized protein (TIGR02117 family)
MRCEAVAGKMRGMLRLGFLLALAVAGLRAAGAAETKPVWLVSNGFHSSLAVRARDVPFRREIAGQSRADALLIGWGAADFYRGKVNPWTVLKATFTPSPSVLHVVPVRGPVARRFAHSDVVEFALSPAQFRILLRELDAAFARDARGQRAFISRGYFADSRFYQGRDRFYFPKMCNVWVAQRLRQSGVPVFVPTAMAANDLVWQAAKLGKRQGWKRRPPDGF